MKHFRTVIHLLLFFVVFLKGHFCEDFVFPIPDSRGNITFSEAFRVNGIFDGGMMTYGRGVQCTGQEEGGTSDTVFIIEEGGTLKNAIIGPDQIEGVHCVGSCVIENVWWSDVCEDALTFQGGHGTYHVIGGGAFNAEDKVFQHNTGGVVHIRGFTVHKFGKLYRSCGNCPEQFQRTVNIQDVVAVEGKTLVGINTNYGDSAHISNTTCANGVRKICVEYEGNDTGDEPREIGHGPSQRCDYHEPLIDC